MHEALYRRLGYPDGLASTIANAEHRTGLYDRYLTSLGHGFVAQQLGDCDAIGDSRVGRLLFGEVVPELFPGDMSVNSGPCGPIMPGCVLHVQNMASPYANYASAGNGNVLGGERATQWLIRFGPAPGVPGITCFHLSSVRQDDGSYVGVIGPGEGFGNWSSGLFGIGVPVTVIGVTDAGRLLSRTYVKSVCPSGVICGCLETACLGGL